MLIYLVRHGEAEKTMENGILDDERDLSDLGRKKIKKQAKGMAAIKICPDVIITGPAKRASETALIIAKELDMEEKIEECQEITPDGDADKIVSLLCDRSPMENVMVIGHEPSIGKVASVLLGSIKSIIEFKKGSVCCLEILDRPDTGEGKLKYHLSPKQLRKMA